VTWPGVVSWLRGEPPPTAVDVRGMATFTPAQVETEETEDDEETEDESPIDLAKELVEKTVSAALERVEELGEDLGAYLDNARWQLPRLQRLRSLSDDTVISLGKTLADQAARIGDKTFFLWRGRAFTYGEAHKRVDAIVRGLLACGVKSGTRVGIMMKSRPSHLSVVAACSRLGAVSVLLSPETTNEVLPRALDLGEVEVLIVDPETAARVRTATSIKVMVLGGVGEQGELPPGMERPKRVIPAGVIDMETIDPTSVTLPTWYKPDSGRARDLAMIFVTSGKHEPLRATRITNRRWAFSALGAAAAATLTTRDTVYCCLPLHHPSGTLVVSGSALAGGARLALASRFEPATFWDEVRRYGVSVIYYAGEMCRQIVDADPVLGEKNNPVRLFAGSGMRPDVWRQLVDRFGPVGVLELYASTEASAVIANAAGKKIGALGRPLPGSPEIAVAAYDFATKDLVHDGSGRLVRARLDEPGMLVAKLARAGADMAHIDPKRILRDAFEPGDTWFITNDLAKVDTVGDYWFVDKPNHMILTKLGPVASTRIEDGVYDCSDIALCVATGVPDPEDSKHQIPLAVVQLHDTSLDLDTLAKATQALPEYARPRELRVIDQIPMTDGYRPIKKRAFEMPARATYRWNALTQRYEPLIAAAAAG
jgi:putative long chain acyl-CoA synthase